MRLFVTITSTAATRPRSILGKSRWLTTPRRTPARIERTCGCSTAGKNSTSRRTVSAASIVCIVETNEMAGLGGLGRGLGGLGVAQLADYDHVRVLAEHAPKRLGERGGVETDLALVDDRAIVAVEDLDRVLDRDDVLTTRPVEVPDHRGDRRRLPDARGAGDEDETVVKVGETPDAGRKPEPVEAGHVARNHADRQRDLASLAESIDAESRQTSPLVRGVELAGLAEGSEPLRIGGADPIDELLELRRVDRRPSFERAQVPVAADDRRLADLQMQVARVCAGDLRQKGV